MAPDPLRYFRVEARELVDQISAGLLDLDQQPGPELVAKLLRYAHTLKGAARVVKQQGIADSAHALEDVLVPHRTGDDPMPADEMRELLRLNDAIEARVRTLEPGGAEPAAAAAAEEPPAGTPSPAAPLEEKRDPNRDQSPIDEPPTVRAVTADLDELLDAIGEATARIAPLRSGRSALERLHRTAESVADQLRGDSGAAAARAGASRLSADLGALGRRFGDAVEQVEREMDEVRGRAEGLRLVAAGSIFTALHRAVRDAADAEGKRVHFTGRGGDVRMGPHLLGQVSGAFLHVVRNAVVHGIEPGAQRQAAGKPADGSITVDVERRGRWAYFRCTDDGRGFDLAAVRRTAEARGMLAPGGPEPDQDTLVDLILHGGISTSATVTEVSGRGIGLDVARDVAAQLRGRVSVRTTPGSGSTVELALPLALLSLNGLVVEVAGKAVTLPLDAVRSCVRLTPEQAAGAVAGGRLAHKGQAVPFLPLAHVLHAGPTVPDSPGPGVAALVHADGVLAAIGVDRLTGTSTLVARPLPDLAPAVPVIGGVSMDLDGNPRLVMDAHGLVAEALRATGTTLSGMAEPAVRLPILVVDDSLTTRMLERSILESAGYEVDLAASGEEGLEKARARRYGLYLTDIDMPGIDGFTFVAQTRAEPDLAVVPAILVSSRAAAADRERGAAVGAGAYVVKGEFDQEELLGHIRRLMREGPA